MIAVFVFVVVVVDFAYQHGGVESRKREVQRLRILSNFLMIRPMSDDKICS